MLTFQQYLQESTHDTGILKAIFVIGTPGAGKSYTVSKLNGSVSPKVVNTDIASEYLSKTLHIPANDETWPIMRDDSKRITRAMLTQYINSLLPLFVDGTSNNASTILNRVGILESFGYDVGCVFVKTDMDVAIARAESRAKLINRSVNPDFIRKVYGISEDNAQYLSSKFPFFKTVKNDTDELGDTEINKIYASVQGFYTSSLKNVVGIRELEKLKDAKEFYLSPTIFPMSTIDRRITSWYQQN